MESLIGKYLRGFMPVTKNYDEYLYLFLDRSEVVSFDQEGEDGYRDAFWEFNSEPQNVPERDSKYKAIGETINSVDSVNIGDETTITIKTNTKIIKLTTEGTDSYYPSSIWEVI